MTNVIHTEEITKEFNTYTVEVTTWIDENAGCEFFQTFINGETLMNCSDTLDDALRMVSGAVWNREDMAQMIAADPERFTN